MSWAARIPRYPRPNCSGALSAAVRMLRQVSVVDLMRGEYRHQYHLSDVDQRGEHYGVLDRRVRTDCREQPLPPHLGVCTRCQHSPRAVAVVDAGEDRSGHHGAGQRAHVDEDEAASAGAIIGWLQVRSLGGCRIQQCVVLQRAAGGEDRVDQHAKEKAGRGEELSTAFRPAWSSQSSADTHGCRGGEQRSA